MSSIHLAAQVVGPAFEVASVRRSEPPQGLDAVANRARTYPGGRYQGTSTLQTLIDNAWELKPYQRIEGSFEILDDWFTVAAKAATDAPVPAPGEPGPYSRLLQTLLMERFRLQVRFHEEMQQGLVLRRMNPDKLGPGLKPSSVVCASGARPAPGPDRALWERCHSGIINGLYEGAVPSMAAFAEFVSGLSRQPVVDETGLQGAYEIKTIFDSTPWLQGLFPRPLPPNDLPTFKDAMRDDLGLRVDTERRPVKILVVEHAEEPIDN